MKDANDRKKLNDRRVSELAVPAWTSREGNHLTNAAIATTTEQRFRYLRILQNALYPAAVTRSRGINYAHSGAFALATVRAAWRLIPAIRVPAAVKQDRGQCASRARRLTPRGNTTTGRSVPIAFEQCNRCSLLDCFGRRTLRRARRCGRDTSLSSSHLVRSPSRTHRLWIRELDIDYRVRDRALVVV